MKTSTTSIAAAGLASLLTTTPVDGARALEPLPEDLEFELALSALPPHLRADAAVYLLDPDAGFELARPGTNGFHAFVIRIDNAAFTADWDYDSYPEDILVPIAYDEAGVPAQMKLHFDVAALHAKGTPARETKRLMRERLDEGYYPVPARAGISYMLSPILRAYGRPELGSEVGTINFPHYMFYAPYVRNDDIGAHGFGQHPFIHEQGPHGYIIKAAGAKETEAINREYAEMLDRLCALNTAYCLQKPDETNQ